MELPLTKTDTTPSPSTPTPSQSKKKDTIQGSKAMELPLTKMDTTPSPSPPYPSQSKRTSPSTWIAIISYLSSLPLLCYGIWILLTKDYNCEEYLHMPHLRLALGVGFLSVFVISCFVTHYGARVVLPGALVLAVALLTMLSFGILVRGGYTMQSRAVPASPLWIRNRIQNPNVWRRVKGCIYDSDVCADLAYSTVQLSENEFGNKTLSPIESGCCKPSRVCGLKYINATYWTRSNANNPFTVSSPSLFSTTNATAPNDQTAIDPSTYGDCQAWSNEITQLCYDCESCKRGFISYVRHEWKLHGIFMVAMSSILMAVHTPRFILTMMDRNTS